MLLNSAFFVESNILPLVDAVCFSITVIDFPACIIGDHHELTAENLASCARCLAWLENIKVKVKVFIKSI